MARLPILMYHNVCESNVSSNGLTISVKNFEAQLKYLKKNGYSTYHFSELQEFNAEQPLPEKTVIITFDDVYVNQLTYAVPLLEKYGFKATFFVPFKYVGENDSWNTSQEAIMSVDELKLLNPSVIELGLHSYAHKKYHKMSAEAIQEDFDHCKRFIIKHKLPVNNVLAYPYGKFPRDAENQEVFFKLLNKNKMGYGLRIGNRVNKFPFKHPYLVERIDVLGEDSIFKFRLKLKFGKLI